MMRSKWRLLISLTYAGLLLWEFVSIGAFHGDISELAFEIVLLFFAVLPIVILSFLPKHSDAMGALALIVAGFGMIAYHANDGDPIGLLIILFYQYCITGIGILAIMLGAYLLKVKS